MADVPLQTTEKIIETAKIAQLITLVKENQLITALVLFVLWQTGAFITAQSHVSGVMC